MSNHRDRGNYRTYPTRVFRCANKKKGDLFKGLVLYFYKLKYKTVNIFVRFGVNKIRVPRGIGQHPLGYGPYDPYAIAYGPYGLRRVTTALKKYFLH
jgi:hypothetical protein